MTDAEKIVFEGVKETKNGIQYVMADRMAALVAIGKHLGLFERAKNEGIDAVAEAIRQISDAGSAMPIRSVTDDDEVEP